MPKITRPQSCTQCPYQYKFLKLLGDSKIENIQNNCMIINFKKGENIIKQGTDVTHAFYLAKGMVSLFIEGKRKNLILKIKRGGDYIGVQTLFGDLKYRYSVSALEDSMVCMIKSDVFLETVKKNPEFLFEITKGISLSYNYTYKKIKDINCKQLRGRMADILLYFSEELFQSTEFEIPMTRKEMAQFASMSMENAVRILSEYKKEGMISVEGRKVNILEMEMLRKISELG